MYVPFFRLPAWRSALQSWAMNTSAASILVLTKSSVLGTMLAEHLAPIGTVQRLPNQAALADFSPSSEAGLLVILEEGYFDSYPDGVKHLKDLVNSTSVNIIRLIGPDKHSSDIQDPSLILPLRLPELLQLVSDQLKKLAAVRTIQPIALSAYCHYLPAERQLLHLQTQETVMLTDIEARIIESLAQADGQAIGREALLQNIWGYNDQITTHTLETHLYRLRNKLASLGESGVDIRAEGGGYVLGSPQNPLTNS